MTATGRGTKLKQTRGLTFSDLSHSRPSSQALKCLLCFLRLSVFLSVVSPFHQPFLQLTSLYFSLSSDDTKSAHMCGFGPCGSESMSGPQPIRLRASSSVIFSTADMWYIISAKNLRPGIEAPSSTTDLWLRRIYGVRKRNNVCF